MTDCMIKPNSSLPWRGVYDFTKSVWQIITRFTDADKPKNYLIAEVHDEGSVQLIVQAPELRDLVAEMYDRTKYTHTPWGRRAAAALNPQGSNEPQELRTQVESLTAAKDRALDILLRVQASPNPSQLSIGMAIEALREV